MKDHPSIDDNADDISIICSNVRYGALQQVLREPVTMGLPNLLDSPFVIPTERAVQRALRTVLHGRTALIIAHRLSTVEIADRVLVLEAGRVVEDGTPADLIATRDGRYAALHTAWLDSLV